MKKYGKSLKKIRLINNYTQKQIALAIKVDQSQVSMWENDINIPSILYIERLADFYNISIDELIDRDYIGYTRK